MRSKEGWIKEVLATEASNDSRIYLYGDNKAGRNPLWMAVGSSAERLHELMPHLPLTKELLEDTYETVSVIYGIELRDLLEYLRKSELSKDLISLFDVGK